MDISFKRTVKRNDGSEFTFTERQGRADPLSITLPDNLLKTSITESVSFDDIFQSIEEDEISNKAFFLTDCVVIPDPDKAFKFFFIDTGDISYILIRNYLVEIARHFRLNGEDRVSFDELEEFIRNYIEDKC